MSESGSVTDTYTYDAFGNLLKSTGRTANNYRYCGEQFDSTTGLYYLRARYMDTSTGRFISQDSYAGSVYDPVSLHKYLYANSNPVTYSDPSGYSVAGTIIAAGALLEFNAVTICAQAILGALIGGMTNATLNWLKGGKTPPDQAFLDGMAAGFICGTAFGCLGVLAAHYWQMALLNIAIQGVFGVNMLAAGYNDFASHNYLAGMVETGLGWASIFTVCYRIKPYIEDAVKTDFTAKITTSPVKDFGGHSEEVIKFINKNVNKNFRTSVAEAFGSNAKVTTLENDLVVYRYSGGGSPAKSYWYSLYPTNNPVADLALPSVNSCEQVDIHIIPKGTTVLEGTVAPNFGQPGGGYQIYVPNPDVVT